MRFSTKTVGSIASHLDYDALAMLHRPTDPTALKAEVVRLRSNGLRPVDISFHLRMSLPQVLEMLRA